jgi:glycosyltransferase involved in cell wall biosynthesis
MTSDITQRPEISIVLPAFNAEQTIQRCLASLEQQTYKNFEIIAVDDGSSDSTPLIIENKARTNRSLRLIRLGKNLGTYEARREGINAACGRWIGFIDADDIARETMLQSLVSKAGETGADIVIGGIRLVDHKRRHLGAKVLFQKEHTIDKNIFEEFCRGSFGTNSSCNKLYKSSLLANGLTPSLPWRQDIGEDTLLNIMTFLKAARVATIKGYLLNYMQHRSSATHKINAHAAFANQIQAYAQAISLTHEGNDKARAHITLMFCQQMQHHCYHASISDIAKNREMILKAIERLSLNYPEGIATMCNKKPLNNLRIPGLYHTTKRARVERRSLEALYAALDCIWP